MDRSPALKRASLGRGNHATPTSRHRETPRQHLYVPKPRSSLSQAGARRFPDVCRIKKMCLAYAATASVASRASKSETSPSRASLMARANLWGLKPHFALRRIFAATSNANTMPC